MIDAVSCCFVPLFEALDVGGGRLGRDIGNFYYGSGGGFRRSPGRVSRRVTVWGRDAAHGSGM